MSSNSFTAATTLTKSPLGRVAKTIHLQSLFTKFAPIWSPNSVCGLTLPIRRFRLDFARVILRIGVRNEMTGIFKFLDRSKAGVLSRLPKEEREKIARNAKRAAQQMKERGDGVSEVQDIRNRRGAEREAA